ncbi:uncharacterized protein KD926_002025 [Aspergillus affinis]|uniref:uncharacterized protein n=1 Tax=Aspergillus affinis TaxID=1070780 RepID=UPI0022FDC203|nr:uncharacterized protein KD926_002025 [Aspergillus affinis]KAI9036371.1 hypothetical protein KD926_002025 [Aspergillus affinis]
MPPSSRRLGSSRKPPSTNKVQTSSAQGENTAAAKKTPRRSTPETEEDDTFSAPASGMESEPVSPITPPLEAYMDGAPKYRYPAPFKSTSKPKLKPTSTPTSLSNPFPQEQNAQPADTNELVQKLLDSMEMQNLMHEELARLDRQLDQQALAHSFQRTTKNLEKKQPSKAREWVKHAKEITARLGDTDSQARCLYWLGRIDWYEGHETDAYFHFSEAAKELSRSCDEMRHITTYLEWLRPGGEKDRRRATLAQHGFHPPHEITFTHVSRKKVPASSAPPHSMDFNRYSRPGVKRKREHLEPDVAIALGLPRKNGSQKQREPRSRTVMTFESDRHVHPGDKVDWDAPRLHHLTYDFSWKQPQQLPHHPPSQNVFDFCKYPKSRASRFRSHKIFTKQPWEEKLPKRTTRRTRADGKTDVTMAMLTEELNPTQYQALRYGYRKRRS